MSQQGLKLSDNDPRLDHSSPTTTGALVIGGEYRGLGVVRSLGRHGIPVCVLTDDHHVAALSRYCQRSLAWPNTKPQIQLRFLLDLAKRGGVQGWTLIPTGDEAAALVARFHSELREHFCLTTSPWDVICWAYDKRLTNELANVAGVAYPKTYYPASREALVSLDCTFPVILKPAIKQSYNAFTHAKAWRADDRAALLAGYDAAAKLISPELIMVQELIPGGGENQYSFACFCDGGKPIATLTARRVRQYPTDFGRGSSFVETIDFPEVAKAATRLLATMQYSGLIEVEFKRDPRTNEYMLLDLNPRVWGWHSIGSRAGVDFAYLSWQAAHGESIPVQHARPGVRWIRFLTDVPAAWSEVVHGRVSFRQYLSSLRGPLEFATFAADDPLPAVLDIPTLCMLAARRRWAAALNS